MSQSSSNKCSSCGGGYKFDVKTLALKCESCGGELAISKKSVKEIPYEEGLVKERAKEWDKFAHSYKCNSCGAVQIVNNADLADTCSFCGSVTLADVENSSDITPDGIIPFRIDEQQAKNAIIERVGKSFWTPNSLLKNMTLEQMKGVFTPTYVFDFVMTGTYSGKLGKTDTRTVSALNGGTSTESYTRWFDVSGKVHEMFDDVVVAAGQIIRSATLARLEPYNTGSAFGFDKNYLHGFIANQSSKKLEIARAQAQQSAEQKVRDVIMRKHNADVADHINLSVGVLNVVYKYILLPVYTTCFEYGGKTYNQYINGETGKAVGKMPKSRGKIFGFVFGMLAAIALIGVLTWWLA